MVYRKIKQLLPTPQTTPNSTPDPTLNLPTPDNPGTPTDVDTPVPGDTPLTPADPSGKTVTDTVKPQQKAEQELPQTGNDHSTDESVLGLLTLALTGLFISGKKQRKE